VKIIFSRYRRDNYVAIITYQQIMYFNVRTTLYMVHCRWQRHVRFMLTSNCDRIVVSLTNSSCQSAVAITCIYIYTCIITIKTCLLLTKQCPGLARTETKTEKQRNWFTELEKCTSTFRNLFIVINITKRLHHLF
jgi:hypothetical protein